MFRNLIVSAISTFVVMSFAPLYAENIQYDYTSTGFKTHLTPPEVYIPPGTYMRGSPNDELCRDGGETLHQVTLTRGFHMMQTEATRQMWVDLKAVQPTLPDDPSDTEYSPTMDHPVQKVSLEEVQLFANLMSLQDGYACCYYTDEAFTESMDASNYTELPVYCNFDANGYRLPTEAEWEYACRAGTTGPFWADEPNYSTWNCSDCQADPPLLVLDSIAWWCGNSRATGKCMAQPVGTKLPNPWGLYDMYGNVVEWCWDYRGSYPSEPVTDPTGPATGWIIRVARGGCYRSSPRTCRSADRSSGTYSSDDLGFRLVRTTDGTPPTPTPTPNCDWLGTRLELSQDALYRAGDTFWLKCHVCTNYYMSRVPTAILLGVYGQFWFWPSWTMNWDYLNIDFYPGLTKLYGLEPFIWPAVDGHVTGLEFYAAMLSPEMTNIVGEYGYVVFGYTDSATPNTPTPKPTSFPTETPTPPANTIFVPQDYPTIQEAIDHAVSGYTVLVADGVYTGTGNKNLNFGGKKIRVRSENGPWVCIIDCENSGRGVIFKNDETKFSILQGFTIRNANPGEENGGAILCDVSNPSIMHCVFENNSVGRSGGGIYMSHCSNPRVLDCAFIGNSAVCNGGGIGCTYSSSPSIMNCVFENNSAEYAGGGIYLYDSHPQVLDCAFIGNSAQTRGGGVSCIRKSCPSIMRCVFESNSAGNSGGGIDAFFDCHLLVFDSAFIGNSAEDDGGGINCENLASITTFNCLIKDNFAGHAGGVHCFNGSEVTIINSSIVNNTSANMGGGLIVNHNSITSILNSILWDNTTSGKGNVAWLYSNATLNLSYCNVENGDSGISGGTLNWGDGMINSNPKFVSGPDGNYYLSQVASGQSSNSPCVDTGSDLAELICESFAGINLCMNDYTTRTDGVNDSGRVDMGYHY